MNKQKTLELEKTEKEIFFDLFNTKKEAEETMAENEKLMAEPGNENEAGIYPILKEANLYGQEVWVIAWIPFPMRGH